MNGGQYISAIRMKDGFAGQDYLKRLPAVRYLADGGVLEFRRKVTFLVGENGTGKSTLIEALAVASGFNPEGGTKNFRFSTNASHSDLWKYLILSKTGFPRDGFFLRAESFYNVATNIDHMDAAPAAAPPVIDSYGGVSLHSQSHGESFMALVQNRFGGNGLYILDEPEAALSPMRLLTLMVEIDRLQKKNSQFIVATHSPILTAFPDAGIFELYAGGIRSVSYRETEHYRVTKSFLDDPEKMLHYLLDR